VGEGFGIDVPGTHALQAVVAHRRGCFKSRINITRIEQMALFGRVRPDAGKAIGLQFYAHRNGFGGLRIALLCGPGFGLNSQQLLYMMSDLVS
jgi:hypothetical protein